MKLPTYDELAAVEEQLQVLEHPLDESLFVAGPPGSGKTVLAVQRAQMLAGESTPLVTYSRMLRRLFKLVGDQSVVPWTMHRFVWHDFQQRTQRNPAEYQSDSFQHDWSAMLEYLRQNSTDNRHSHIVIDEGQDLPKGFFQYIRLYATEVMTVFADDDQAIGERATTLEEIKEAADLDDPIVLDQNHRNTPQIAQLAEHFHSGRLPAATVRRPPGDLPRLLHCAGSTATARRISEWFRNRGGSIGVIVNRNITGSGIRAALGHQLPEGTRLDFYDSQSKNDETINILEPGVTILNKESVKGQEFDTVFILELECFLPCANNVERRAMYMMCARARDHLFLVHDSNLGPVARAALPGSDILEAS